MKIHSKLILLIPFLLLFVNGPTVANLNHQTQGSLTVPFGHGSLDLELVIEHHQQVSSGGTAPASQVGNLLFYNVDTFNMPELGNLFDNSNPLSLSADVDLLNSQLFFKIIREDSEHMELQPGFILGNDVVFSLNQDFVPNDLVSGLLSYTIPKDLTMVFPSSFNQFRNPTNESTFFDEFIGGNIVPPGLNLFLEPGEWGNHDLFYDWMLNDLAESVQTVEKNYINWAGITQEDLPPNVVITRPYSPTCCPVLYETLIVQNSQVNISFPSYHAIPWESSIFDTSVTDPWAQINSPVYFDFQSPRTVNVPNTPDGTELTVVYEPSGSIYAIDGVVSILDDELSTVYGVFIEDDYDWDNDWDNQTATNYYLGGSNTDTKINLGVNPPDERLLVVYRPVEYPTVSYTITHNPGISFIIDLEIGSITTPQNLHLVMVWDAQLGPYNGWFDYLELTAHGDFN
ncbi:MAG: hypothetical protein ACW98D_19790, partial [Promethearchaeota archaeon]